MILSSRADLLLMERPFPVSDEGGAAFDPSSIAGLQFWLDAADGSTLFQDEEVTIPAESDGDPVGCWRDKSGSDWHLTSPNGISGGNDTNRPSLETNQINGLPVVQMNGVNHFIRQVGGDISISGTSKTIFIAGKRTSFVGANEALLSLVSDGQNDFDNEQSLVIAHSTNGTDLSDSRNELVLVDCANPGNGNAFVYTTQYTGTDQTAWMNGQLGGIPGAQTLTSTGTLSIERISLGFRQQASNDNIGNPNSFGYAEVLIYDGALSIQDRQAVENYLMEKWGVTPGVQLIAPTNVSASLQSGPSIQITWTDPAFVPLSIRVGLYNVTQDVLEAEAFQSAGSQIHSFGSVTPGDVYEARVSNNSNRIAYFGQNATATSNQVTP